MGQQPSFENESHLWIIRMLKDIETYAQINEIPRIPELMSAARGAATCALKKNIDALAAAGSDDDRWFDVVLDELARYAHLQGLTEIEDQLILAHEMWQIERDKRQNEGTVIPFTGRQED